MSLALLICLNRSLRIALWLSFAMVWYWIPMLVYIILVIALAKSLLASNTMSFSNPFGMKKEAKVTLEMVVE